MLVSSWPANATVATSINKRLSIYRRHIDDQSTRAGIGRHHLAFAVANCVLNRWFASVTVGCCGDCWKLRRVAGEARNMTENALSILIIFSVHLQQTETSGRKLFIFHHCVWLTRCITCKVYWNSHIPRLRAQQKMVHSQISYEIWIVNRY